MTGPAWPTNTADAASTGGGAGHDSDSLLVIDGDRSFTLHMPASGELVIGRGPEAGHSVEDPLVSRNHAQLLVGPDGLRVADLGSRHGTLLNGDRLTEPRILRSGDVVTIGNTLFVVRRVRAARPSRDALDPSAFVRRLADELARCATYERELALLCVRTAEGDTAALVAPLAARLRSIDTITPIGRRHLCVLLPELDIDEAVAVAQQLVKAAPGKLSIGVAAAPYDGIDADSLVSATRMACELQGTDRVARAGEAVETLAIGNHRIVVGDPAMTKLYELVRRVARSTIPVLIQGETGVGKELAAATVHASSPRANGPFISVNCAAIPETLAESELFGHVKGAFSGAVTNKIGYIEAAAGGTLFLDEIGELSLTTQAKLLRVLESGELIRVGEVKPRTIEMRIVAATNRDLQKEIDEGRFRSDLYFRLGAARLEIPPLRERPRDIALLTATMLRDACARLGRPSLDLSIGAAVALFRHAWPGNIRELRHVIEYAAAAVPDSGTAVEIWHLPTTMAAAARRDRDGAPEPARSSEPAAIVAPGAFRPIADEVRELERARMIAALRASTGVQNRAAELIEMPLRTFVTKLKRYAIMPNEWT
ncbi:MAG: sigma 54-interacting transcriptional regulator [Kofleriaceae bacterium]